MQQDLIMLLYGGAIIGWIMCCFHSYNWIKKDCGWDDEERQLVETSIINDTDETTIVEAIIIDEL